MHARLFFAACASAALLSAAACSNSNDQTANSTERAPGAAAAPNATGTSGSADDTKAQPITLSGCLQKGDHGDYILTEINEPAPGATSDKSANKVEREDLNAAEHAYRLKNDNGKDSDLDNFVGRQIRVSGTVAKRSDIDQKVGTSGSNDKDNKGVKLHDSDLAQVDVTNVQQTAASCGHGAKRSTAGKPRMK